MKRTIHLQVEVLEELKTNNIISGSLADYWASGILRDLSKTIQDDETGSELYRLGKEMASKASGHLFNGWQDGDPVCPSYWPVGGSLPPIPDFPPREPYGAADNTDESKDIYKAPANILNAFALIKLSSLVSGLEWKKSILAIGEKFLSRQKDKLMEEYKAANLGEG